MNKKMDKNHVLAVFSLASFAFISPRGLNENEKKLLADAFESLDIEDDMVRIYIVNMYTDLFNYIMEGQ